MDFHGAFASARDYAAHAAGLNDLNLLFVEDPVPSFELREVGASVSTLELPIASGEDLITPSAHRELVECGVSYLRVDATTIGGLRAAHKAAGAAASSEARVLPHVWPHIHAALAVASGSVYALEVIPDYVGAEPLGLILAETLRIEDGRWRPSSAPGLDLRSTWRLWRATRRATAA